MTNVQTANADMYARCSYRCLRVSAWLAPAARAARWAKVGRWNRRSGWNGRRALRRSDRHVVRGRSGRAAGRGRVGDVDVGGDERRQRVDRPRDRSGERHVDQRQRHAEHDLHAHRHQQPRQRLRRHRDRRRDEPGHRIQRALRGHDLAHRGRAVRRAGVAAAHRRRPRSARLQQHARQRTRRERRPRSSSSSTTRWCSRSTARTPSTGCSRASPTASARASTASGAAPSTSTRRGARQRADDHQRRGAAHATRSTVDLDADVVGRAARATSWSARPAAASA